MTFRHSASEKRNSKFGFALVVLAFFFFCATSRAQTIPHVSGTFKTPEGKTPAQAGLKSIATIGAVPVYGSIDFAPYDSSGNRPTRILCASITYIPQNVRGWIKSDGALVDNYTGAAGVDLVPTIGCTPAGLVIRAKITLAPTPDGRIPSFTWTEDKQMPAQSTADWGALAVAGITAPSYTGYATVADEGISLAARNTINFTGTGVTCVDDALNLRTNCDLSAASGGATVQTNSVNNTSQAVLDFQTGAAVNGLSIVPANPSGGVEKFTLSGTLAAATGLSGLVPIANGGLNNGAVPSSDGQIPIWNAAQSKYIPGDPFVSGVIAHDAPGAAINPVLAGCYANAAAPADVSADVDAVREWCLRNGSQVVNLASGGTLITIGQKTLANSLPVAIASDQGAVPVSGTVTANIGTSGSLALDATLTGGNLKAQGNVASGASDSGNPLKMGGIFQTTQPTVTNGQRVDFQATARGAQIVATGVDAFAVNATQAGNWTARIVGNAGGILDAAGQNASSPANELLIAGQFNTTPTTITSGNVSPLQLDNAGNLKVNIIAGGGTGGGPADVGLSTAASESDAARQKVTSALRLWDQAAGAGSQLVGWRGDTTSGAWVNCKSGCSSSGFTDNSTFTLGTTSISPVGGVFDDTPPTAITTGKAASARITNNRALHINLRNQAGTEIGTSGAPVRTDPTGTTTQPVSGTVTANIGTSGSLALDASVTALEVAQGSTTSGQKGILGLGAVTTAAPTYTTAQSSPLSLTTAGALRVDGSAATQPVSGTVTANVGTTNGLALDATLTGGNLKAQGNVASGASDSGNPLKVGGIFNTTQPTVTNAQRVDLQATARGELMIAKGVSGLSIDNTGFNVNNSPTVQPGNTANTTPWLMTINQGGNSALVSAAGNLKTECAVGCGGSSFTTTYNTPPNWANPLAPLSLANGATAPFQSDAFGRLLTVDPYSAQILAALQQSIGLRNALNLVGSFNRRITSTGDALDVNVKYPAASFDPCDGRKTGVAISQIASTVLIAGPSGRVQICSMFIHAVDSENVALVEGTGAVCATSTAGIVGGSAAANGPNLSAGTGWVEGNGRGTIAPEKNPGYDVCLLQSGTGRVAGNITYVVLSQ